MYYEANSDIRTSSPTHKYCLRSRHLNVHRVHRTQYVYLRIEFIYITIPENLFIILTLWWMWQHKKRKIDIITD
jgi:hypothetical protein